MTSTEGLAIAPISNKSAGDFLRVSALYRGRLTADLRAFQPTHVVSLFDPSIDPAKIPSFGVVPTMQRAFYDHDTPGAQVLSREMLGEIIDFLSDWTAAHRRGDDARLLVHCHMGASRSTATALMALTILHGPNQEARAFADLLQITNKPWPNYNLVEMADDLLGREGRLMGELLRYRAAHPGRFNAYMRLNLRRGQLLPDWPAT